MKRTIKILITIIFALSFFACINLKVSASENFQIAVGPNSDDSTKSWFMYTLVPGDSAQDSIKVMNLTNNEVKIKLYPADGTTTTQGDFTLKLENEPKELVGSWVSLEKSELDLQPNSMEIVNFTLKVPDLPLVGDYAGGIIAQAENNDQSSTLTIINRVGVRIYVSLKGEKVIKYTVDTVDREVTQSGLDYLVTISNQGNVIGDPDLNLHLTIDPYNIKKDFKVAKVGDIFPGKTRIVRISTSVQQSIIEWENVTGNVVLESNEVATFNKSFSTILPQAYLLILFIIVIFIYIIVLIYKKRRKHHEHLHVESLNKHPANEAEEISEKLMHISMRTKVIGTILLILIVFVFSFLIIGFIGKFV